MHIANEKEYITINMHEGNCKARALLSKVNRASNKQHAPSPGMCQATKSRVLFIGLKPTYSLRTGGRCQPYSLSRSNRHRYSSFAPKDVRHTITYKSTMRVISTFWFENPWRQTGTFDAVLASAKGARTVRCCAFRFSRCRIGRPHQPRCNVVRTWHTKFQSSAISIKLIMTPNLPCLVIFVRHSNLA